MNATNRATAPNFPWAGNDSECLQSSRSGNWPSCLFWDDYPSPVKHIFIKNPHGKSYLPCAMLIIIRLAFLCLRPSQFFLFCSANRSNRVFSNWFAGNPSCHVGDAIRLGVKPDADDPAVPVSYDGATPRSRIIFECQSLPISYQNAQEPATCADFLKFFRRAAASQYCRFQIADLNLPKICNLQCAISS